VYSVVKVVAKATFGLVWYFWCSRNTSSFCLFASPPVRALAKISIVRRTTLTQIIYSFLHDHILLAQLMCNPFLFKGYIEIL
jgi:hypothetical protein